MIVSMLGEVPWQCLETASDAVLREMPLQGAGDASVLYLVPWNSLHQQGCT